MDWWKYRRPDGTIDLIDAFINVSYGENPSINTAIEYLRFIESLQPINSRQAAAIVLATAHDIASRP